MNKNNNLTIRTRLESRNRHVILETLQGLSASETDELFDIIEDLVFHYNPEIRAAALHCLQSVSQSELKEIIRHSIKDPHAEVRQAALLLFHMK